MPNCTHWRGHKFEPRYSKVPPTIERLAASGLESVTPRLIESLTETKYECDVCVRCGHITKMEQPK